MRSTRSHAAGNRAARITDVEVTAYEIPTVDDHESDGTLVWDSTTIVVVQIAAGGHTGLGYTYADPSVAAVIEGKLAPILVDADPLMPARTWAEMQVKTRQLGNTGLNAMAISAVDIALWDLKARLLGVCLADALPRFHESVPIYGSGGFTSLSADELRRQIEGWVADGFRSVKIKVGRDKPADNERVEIARAAAGDEVELMVDGNGAYTPAEAIEWAHRFHAQGVRYFEEPVSSQDLDGLADVRRHAPGGMSIAAGEYGWNLPYFHQMLAPARSTSSRPTSPARGGSPTCCASTGCARRAAGRSRRTAPRRCRPTCAARWRRCGTSNTSSITTASSRCCSTARSIRPAAASRPTGRAPASGWS